MLWGNGQREVAAGPDRGRQKRGRLLARVDSPTLARFVGTYPTYQQWVNWGFRWGGLLPESGKPIELQELSVIQ